MRHGIKRNLLSVAFNFDRPAVQESRGMPGEILNRAAARLFKVPPQSARGRTLAEVVRHPDLNQFVRRVAGEIRSRHVFA